MTKFSRDFVINYNVRTDLKATPVQMIFNLQELALLHSVEAGFPMTWFTENMRGWILTNWQIQFFDFPSWNETIEIYTWPTFFKGIVGERAFSAFTKNNKPLLYGNSVWIYTDLEKKRPVRPSEEMIKGYGQIFEPDMQKDFEIPDERSFSEVYERTYKSERRDGDTNFHVNNIRYLEWAFDDIPEESYMGKLNGIKASYKKQCVVGEKVNIKLYEQRSGNKTNYLTRIINESGFIASEIFTAWE